MIDSVEDMNSGPARITIAEEKVIVPADFPESYMDFFFPVPQGVKKVGVKAAFDRKEGAPELFISLFDPSDYRGTQMNFIRNGTVVYDLWVSQADSAPGCIPGGIPAGTWRIQLDIRQLNEPVRLSYEAYYETEDAVKTMPSPFFDNRIINPNPGWYRGELHAHSNESDGTLPVNELIRYAHASGLDFLSVTDHFTVSQWWRINAPDLPEMALINASEITSKDGHANIHGIRKWVDAFIDRDAWNINQVAEETHRQGGLFCVNHALLSAVYGWRLFDFNWQNADLIEIFHGLLGPNNMPLISLWDGLLREGYRIIGVGGTDCHNPENATERLGRIFTLVHANELSASGILAGLKAGNVYISTGPEMGFSVENSKGRIALMGEKIQSGGHPIKLTISIKSGIPLRITIIKNGFFLHSTTFKPGKDSRGVVKFVDEKPARCYYRVEFHKAVDNFTYPEIEWRDHTIIQALGNPIWVE